MITAEKDSTKVIEKTSIVFIDRQNKMNHQYITHFSAKLNIETVSIIDSFPEETSKYDCLFFYAEGYDQQIAKALARYSEIKDDHCHFILVHDSCKEKELLPYLIYPLNGIVSLDYLHAHPDLIYESIKEKGVFLEPTLHYSLIIEIEKRKEKDIPIEKLILNRGRVANLLTENEQDVLQLILDGLNNGAIAKTLYLAPSTVSTIIGQLLKKLQANDRTDAMVKAIRNGWVDAKR